MESGHAWGIFSLVVLGCDGLACILLLDAGYDAPPVLTAACATGAAYVYIMYKRYRVEVVPASDLKLFDDVEDLRILSRIYALDPSGNEAHLRRRLESFAGANEGRVFVWIVPRIISGLTSSERRQLSPSELAAGLLSDKPQGPRPETRPLIGAAGRGSAGRTRSRICPICEEKAPLVGTTCKHCGADLEFYAALARSRVGRRLVSEKSSAVRRKLRYDVPSIRERT